MKRTVGIEKNEKILMAKEIPWTGHLTNKMRLQTVTTSGRNCINFTVATEVENIKIMFPMAYQIGSTSWPIHT